MCHSEDLKKELVAEDLLTHVEGKFTYMSCSKCHSWQLSPIPSRSFLKHCYENQENRYSQTKDIKRTYDNIRKTVNFKGVNKSENFRVANLNPLRALPGKALDIGCGQGFLLYKLKCQGWSVVGSELNSEVADEVRRQGQFEVLNKDAFELSFEPNTFDLIIMSMVLEHLDDPRRILEKIHNWLKPGGELLFSVPCVDGVEFRLFKEYSYGLQPPYHIFLPSNKGISNLARSYFSEVRLASQTNHRDFIESGILKYRSDFPVISGYFKLMEKCSFAKKIIRLFLKLAVFFGYSTSRVSLSCLKGQACE